MCSLYGHAACADTLPLSVPSAEAAMEGRAESQHRIGYYYQIGEHFEKDWEQALYWYKKAADQDLLKSQYSYAWILAFEKDGPHDYQGALPWFIKAATPRDKSQGYGYHKSIGYAQKSLDWYCKTGAVEFPSTHEYASKAQCLYGRARKLYAGSTKYGVQRDLSASRIMLEKAAHGGDERAFIILAKMHRFGLGVPRDMRRAQEHLSKAGKSAFTDDDYIRSDHRMIAAELGDASEHRIFASRYLKGTKYQYDPEKAMIHLFLSHRRKFLEGGNSDLLLPVIQKNDSALLSRAHQEALRYARENNWPKTKIAKINNSYQRVVKQQDWLAKRGGVMPSKLRSTIFKVMGMAVLLMMLQLALSFALFIIRQWRIYQDRPRRTNPFG